MGQFRKGASFDTQGEDGCADSVVAWVEYIHMDEGGRERYNGEPSGFESLRLEDGRHVRAMGDERYETGSSGLVLHRVFRSTPAHDFH
ncbi:hypothetical protein [Caldimonas brevitalea]|uniref:Uncharacterized protein n=1 Tax=Caldimonas brevitalea TaxID=413882 RepID=A0A0G3BUX9_9BURK|nr:hypothetical protein [Caldimonas brevitalea]AKJ31196.1 hypothetical protein AAW51_4505 [Caldimonas brevitalea]